MQTMQFRFSATIKVHRLPSMTRSVPPVASFLATCSSTTTTTADTAESVIAYVSSRVACLVHSSRLFSRFSKHSRLLRRPLKPIFDVVVFAGRLVVCPRSDAYWLIDNESAGDLECLFACFFFLRKRRVCIKGRIQRGGQRVYAAADQSRLDVVVCISASDESVVENIWK